MKFKPVKPIELDKPFSYEDLQDFMTLYRIKSTSRTPVEMPPVMYCGDIKFKWGIYNHFYHYEKGNDSHPEFNVKNTLKRFNIDPETATFIFSK